jgi:hypothetical protein
MRDPVTPKNSSSAATTTSSKSGAGRINMEPGFKVSKFQSFKQDQ